jgi:D-glycero-alpha-D-manno-heptose 1-phosphate guanylyltransferase
LKIKCFLDSAYKSILFSENFNKKMLKEALILAGGLGTRLQSVVSDVPKPMAQVAGKPFVEYILKYLKEFGVERVVLSIGYKAEAFQEYFGKNYQGLELEYVIEKEPLGTGGALKLALKHCLHNDVLVLNGDTFFNIELDDLWIFHLLHQADITIALREVENASRYGTVQLNNDGKITAFIEKTGKEEEGLINAGIYIVKKTVFKNYTLPEKFSLEKDFFEKYLTELKLYGCVCEGYFIDIGIPEDYKKAQDDFKNFTD